MATTEAENKEKARRSLEEAFEEGNLGLLNEIVADDFVGRNNAAPEPYHGPQGIKEFISMNRTAFSDLEVTAEEVIADGDTVVQQSTGGSGNPEVTYLALWTAWPSGGSMHKANVATFCRQKRTLYHFD